MGGRFERPGYRTVSPTGLADQVQNGQSPPARKTADDREDATSSDSVCHA